MGQPARTLSTGGFRFSGALGGDNFPILASTAGGFCCAIDSNARSDTYTYRWDGTVIGLLHRSRRR